MIPFNTILDKISDILTPIQGEAAVVCTLLAAWIVSLSAKKKKNGGSSNA